MNDQTDDQAGAPLASVARLAETAVNDDVVAILKDLLERAVSGEDALPAVEFFTPWHAVHEVQRSVDDVIIARDRWQDPPDLVLSFSTEEAAAECYEAILGAMEGDR